MKTEDTTSRKFGQNEHKEIRRYTNRLPLPDSSLRLSNGNKSRQVERAIAELFQAATSEGRDVDLSTLRIKAYWRFDHDPEALEISIDSEPRD